MASDGKPRAGSKAGRTDGPADRSRQRARPSDRPFDLWLQKQLHAMYDEIASEPLPNDLLKMIDHDAAQGDGKDETDGPPTKKP